MTYEISFRNTPSDVRNGNNTSTEYCRAGLTLTREPRRFSGLTEEQLANLRSDRRVILREVE